MALSPDLYLEERRQAIASLVNSTGRVTVTELSRNFGVSEVTIRQDLHGGAVPAAGGLAELQLGLRRQTQVTEKTRIGAAGAALVQDGDAILLDASSTSLAIAHHLRSRQDLTVITYSLEVLNELTSAPQIDIVLMGGFFQRATMSLIGVYGLEQLRQYNIRLGFFGAHGLDAQTGLTDVSATEARVKAELLPHCREVVAVLDATKWGRVGSVTFAAPHNIQRIITNAGAPPALVAAMEARGVVVISV
jgi:DeoR/GlpR family transcriptional regulator of sugar metabolism